MIERLASISDVLYLALPDHRSNELGIERRFARRWGATRCGNIEDSQTTIWCKNCNFLPFIQNRLVDCQLHQVAVRFRRTCCAGNYADQRRRSEEHTSELQSRQ